MNTNTVSVSRRGRVANGGIGTGAQLSVYDGRDRIGAYQHRDDGFLAFDRLGHSLGVFDTPIEAANAISKAKAPA
jgi:hypothetical protein